MIDIPAKKRRNWTEQEEAKLCRLRDQGKTLPQIAQSLRRSRSAVGVRLSTARIGADGKLHIDRQRLAERAAVERRKSAQMRAEKATGSLRRFAAIPQISDAAASSLALDGELPEELEAICDAQILAARQALHRRYDEAMRDSCSADSGEPLELAYEDE